MRISARRAKGEAMKTTETQLNGEPSSTTKAIVAAHDGYVGEAMESMRWFRRGFLRRLVREERPG
jgi:hypothetical protein